VKPINLDIKETPENIEIFLPKLTNISETIEDEGHKFIDGVKRYYLIRGKSHCVICRHNKTSEYIYTKLIPTHPFNHLVLFIIAVMHLLILAFFLTSLINLILENKTQVN
jgi:hypothetical protein